MENYKNLIPMNKLTKDEQRNIASKGGKASGKARTDKKTFRDLFAAALSICDDSGLTEQEKIVFKAIEVAKMTGNYKDIEATLGEKPTDKIDASINSENKDVLKDYLEAAKNGKLTKKD